MSEEAPIGIAYAQGRTVKVWREERKGRTWYRAEADLGSWTKGYGAAQDPTVAARDAIDWIRMRLNELDRLCRELDFVRDSAVG